ncbi:MAG TPA: hydrogenase nickel incorporation protein HypB [Stellaceae bacterium]|nr:hydrogenase nickel incorporation protein HypB [Stellaceae bacterium]
MCGICGCGAAADGEDHVHADGTRHRHGHGGHSHDHDHDHVHGHGHGPHRVDLEARILAKNDELAARNRAWFAGRRILAINLMSSPGAGKTSLLERMIRDWGRDLALSVLEGDQATALDRDRIRAAGAPAVQLSTGTGCHLDAEMVARGLRELDPADGSVVLIENVGNLVCPALFDLGEHAKAVILSVTEGEDKPLKYPHMFAASSVMIVNKIDLLPHVDFDVARAVAFARTVNPGIDMVEVSAKTGQGLDRWRHWLRHEAKAVHASP